ncbi:MAG: hypothetical protein KAY24_12820, partial [Candidatus Eisenbacteria sp.]|nr:hypothetical protein [Candidatus Eisenbacteria bacterium]
MSISTARLGLQGFRGLRRQPKRSRVGIEAGETWLRFAQQSRREGGHPWSVAEAHLSPGRMDDSKETGRHLSRVVRGAGISRGSAICAISSPAIDIFPLNLRTTGPGELDGLVVSQVREQLSYSIEKAVLDYAVLPDRVRRTGDDTTAVLAFAAPRALVESLLQTLERAGIVLDRLLTPACVLAPTVAQSDPQSRHLLIATGEDATSVSVVEGGYVLLERILSWSLGSLIRHLQAELDLEEGQCRSLLTRTPLAETPDVQEEAVGTSERSLESTLQEVLGPSFQE